MCVGYVKHHNGGVGPFKKPKYDDMGTSSALAPVQSSFYGETANAEGQEKLRKKRNKNGLSFLTRALDRNNNANPFTLLNSMMNEKNTLG